MSKPVFEDLFSFEGRRNRKSYIYFSLAMIALSMVLGFVLVPIAVGTGGVGMVLFVLFLPILVSSWAVGAQRCRDFGWSGWAILIAMIPYVGVLFALAILFIPGNQGANRYGADPVGPSGAVAI
ncbi:DUF805 domain-containing protein [Pseudophaeobacter sp.]|jgi:uncharacterized membrane protein YhaH (DUF805 family)|uniref:DUF805 domain-containing protein n=1 Tax=Pseudophaeobacter sp. TaxID=1971739 RepID=UPI00260E85FE|nr:DUF805 domain-containing protein [Pseudophaeobacter sp.]